MANPMKGEAKLRDYTLAYNFGVLCSVEEMTGKKVPQLLQSLTEGLGFGELRAFLYCGLQTHHPGTTEAEVGNIVEEFGYKDCVQAVGKGFTGFFGAQKAGPKNPPKPAR